MHVNRVETALVYLERFQHLRRRVSFYESTGIVRRIVLPAELRRTMDIGERETMEIFTDGPSIVLKKYTPACIFCDSGRSVSLFKGKSVCARCLRQLRESSTESGAPEDQP